MFLGDIKVRMEGAHGRLSLRVPLHMGDPTEKTSPGEAPLLLSQKHSHKGQNRRAFSRGPQGKGALLLLLLLLGTHLPTIFTPGCL